MINQEMLKSNWNAIVGAVQETFGQISGDDLARVQGNVEQFFGLMQQKAGQSREQVEQFLADFSESAGSTISNAMETASEMATDATRYVSQGYEAAAESAERGYDYAREVVERRPIESLAVVVGTSLLAGVLIGLSLSRR